MSKHKNKSKAIKDKESEYNENGVKYRSGMRINLVFLAIMIYFPLSLMMLLPPGLPDKAKAMYGTAGFYGTWVLFAVATLLFIGAWQFAFGPDKDDKK